MFFFRAVRNSATFYRLRYYASILAPRYQRDSAKKARMPISNESALLGLGPGLHRGEDTRGGKPSAAG